MKLLVTTTLLVLLVSGGCAHAPKRASLYDRLGGAPVISSIIDTYLEEVASDTRIVALFGNTDIPKLRKHLNEYVCLITGGGCIYTGRTMEESHEGLQIDEAEFNAFVEDLLDAMDKQRIPTPLQNELIALLAPMRRQIIHR